MANYSSSQNGNFSSSSTWGGNTPAAGDNLTINHTVTVDTGLTNPTTGFGDITIANNGTLTNADNATLRVNGVIRAQTTNSSQPATIHFKDHFVVEFKGTNGDNHGLQVDNAAGCHLILEGDDPTAVTTTSAATDGNVCTHSLTSASNFAAGDWIQIYSYDYTSTTTENDGKRFDDEGFWIHDVSGNTIYTRDFVGPEDSTVTSVNGTTITVSNSKVFREGMQVIFGTGSNRNIRTISSINYNTHRMVLDSAVTGTVTGEVVYRAMSLKPHPSGSKVRKMAWQVTSEAASGANTLTLNTTAGLSVGDRIWVEKRSEAESTTDSADQNSGYDYVISSISGNTLTLSSNLGYKVVETSLISLMTRSIRFDTVTTDGSDYYHVYVEHRSGYDRFIALKDVQFNGIGDPDNNVRTGVVLRGENTLQNPPVTLTQTIPTQHRGTWVEGITTLHWPGHERDWGSIWIYDARSCVVRGCTCLYGDDGIALYYEPYNGALGNITAGMTSFGLRFEGMSEQSDCAYMYVSRCNNRIRHTSYDGGIGGIVHNIICDATDYAGVGWYKTNPGEVWRCKFTGISAGVLTESIADQTSGMLDSFVAPLSGRAKPEDLNGTSQQGSYRMSHYNRGGSSASTRSIEHNFEYDAMRCYGYYWEAVWDHDEDAWHFSRYTGGSNNPSMGETVYIPANRTARFTVKCKGVTGFSGTRPYAFAIDQKSAYSENVLGFTATTNRPLRGERYNVQFTSAFDSDYEEAQITISAEPFSRYYKIGVRADNNNAREGFYIKEFNFYLDGSVNNRMFLSGSHGSVNPVTVSQFRTSFTQQKKRLGGRIK